MDIKKNIGTNITSTLIIKSLLWNIIKTELGTEIPLRSLGIRGKYISIKTGNPLINFEIQNKEMVIQEHLKKKLKQVGVSFTDFEIRYF